MDRATAARYGERAGNHSGKSRRRAAGPRLGGRITPRIEYRDVMRLRGIAPRPGKDRSGEKRRPSSGIAACVTYVRTQVESVSPASRAESHRPLAGVARSDGSADDATRAPWLCQIPQENCPTHVSYTLFTS
jgi:hypothetical protein